MNLFSNVLFTLTYTYKISETLIFYCYNGNTFFYLLSLYCVHINLSLLDCSLSNERNTHTQTHIVNYIECNYRNLRIFLVSGIIEIDFI
jgi:hypothetical protein